MIACFDGILGNDPQKKYLSRVIEKDQLAHAYCFSGSVGTGKVRIVEAIVQHLLGDEVKFYSNVLHIKRLFDEKNSKEKKHISVDQIRALRERLSMSSFGGEKKIAIIHDADTLTIAAQNALLKTLEEPSGDTHIFLLLSDSKALLDTILSRVVHLRFQRIPREEICSLLRQKGLRQEKAHTLAGIVDGRPVLAETLIEQGWQEEMKERLDVCFSFLEGGTAARLRDSEKLAKSAKEQSDVKIFLLDMRRVLHDILSTSVQLTHICAFSDQEERLKKLAKRHNTDHWIHALKTTEASLDHIQKNGNTTIALEHLSLSL